MSKLLTRFRQLPYQLQITFLSLLYIVTGKIGFLFAHTGGNVTLIWPPTGISLAVILLLGYRYWPMIPIGAILLNVTSGTPLPTAALMSVGNILEALGGVYLLKRFSQFNPSFTRVYDAIGFIGFAAVIGTTFSATIGVAALCLTGLQDWVNYGSIWWMWWLGDAMSAMLLTPVLLVCWPDPGNKQVSITDRKLEFGLFLVFLIFISVLVFDTALATARLYPLAYITFPFVMWAALRFGQRETLISSLLISLIATLGTTQNTGPFIRADVHDSLIYLWTYVGTITITALLLSSALAERSGVQEALVRSEGRFRSIFEGAMVGIAVINQEGITLSANEALAQMLGYSHAELLQTTFRQLTYPDDIHLSEKQLERLLSNEIQHYSLEKRYLHKDGHVIWAQVSISQFPGEVVGRHVRIAIIEDISERRRAEAARVESEARFRAIFNGATVGIAVIDWDGYTITANETLIRMFGYSEAELREITFLELTHPDDRSKSARLVAQVMQGEIPHVFMEKRYLCKNGDVMWGQVNISVFPGEIQGRKVRIAIIQDISERKRAELALHHLNSELEQRVADRTAELSAANERLTELDRLKSKFIADVSHELRTPLTVLNTRVYLLERSRPDQWQSYLGGLRDQIDRLIHFVNTILDLSRLELAEGKIAFGQVNLNEVVEQVAVALAPRAEAIGLNLTMSYSADLPSVYGESNQLAQVATNLIANAINYTPNGLIEVSTAANGHYACLRVRDTGIGIPAGDMPHLFERFYRGERTTQSNMAGTGLGLSIVKEIVDLHGGKIEVDSQVGQGSTFIVWLPFWNLHHTNANGSA
jgi:PAS domain S-box-containing protein